VPRFCETEGIFNNVRRDRPFGTVLIFITHVRPGTILGMSAYAWIHDKSAGVTDFTIKLRQSTVPYSRIRAIASKMECGWVGAVRGTRLVDPCQGKSYDQDECHTRSWVEVFYHTVPLRRCRFCSWRRYVFPGSCARTLPNNVLFRGDGLWHTMFAAGLPSVRESVRADLPTSRIPRGGMGVSPLRPVSRRHELGSATGQSSAEDRACGQLCVWRWCLPCSNTFIGTFKDTSWSDVNLYELTGALKLALARSPNGAQFYREGYVFIAVSYLICWYSRSAVKSMDREAPQYRHPKMSTDMNKTLINFDHVNKWLRKFARSARNHP